MMRWPPASGSHSILWLWNPASSPCGLSCSEAVESWPLTLVQSSIVVVFGGGDAMMMWRAPST